MLILILILFIVLFLALLFAIFKIGKWTLKEKLRVKWAISIISVLVLALVIKRVFFTKMEFIQSNVYSNLYIVENPDKETEAVKNAILNKIKEHLITKPKSGKKLTYSGGNAIYFYELGGRTFGFLGEAGTSYFIDHEEDYGGFVSEELGMYQNLRLAEFYYEAAVNDSNSICGEINWFDEGEFIKTDTICNLQVIKSN